ncbi:hypothetical protein CTEN210_13937 [Chaetoceros tenuissimus]|uniref:Proteasome subunit beta n=1 Tax=Chaetoceros tenuissimus TaxID=426638 RepID=A0AAD3D409_9STRA|nr:hypothetical protein CTEN210_13937 [Chaetoceros tenuissimus]
MYISYYFPVLILLLLSETPNAQQQQDPTTLNGGSIMAMSGENCVAIAVDKRFGSGPQMIHVKPRTVLCPNSQVMVGLVGLEGDVQTLAHELSTHIDEKVSRYSGFDFSGNMGLEVRKKISPKSTSILLSHLLYSKRNSPYYVEPIVAGLELVTQSKQEKDEGDGGSLENERIKRYVPFLCAQDLIGAQSKSNAFVCSGAASKSLYGCAEALWRPNLKPDELLQICGRAFVSALERDCLSGYGAVIYLMEGGKGITQYDVSCRND